MSPFDSTAYKLNMNNVYRNMQAGKAAIEKARRDGATAEGVANRTRDLKAASLAEIRTGIAQTVARANARRADIERTYTKEPTSAFSLDMRKHQIATERDRAAVMTDGQLQTYLATLAGSDRADIDDGLAAVYGAEARRRGDTESADAIGTVLARPAWVDNEEHAALEKIATQLTDWDSSGIHGFGPYGTASPSIMAPLPDSVIGGSIMSFEETFANIEKRELPAAAPQVWNSSPGVMKRPALACDVGLAYIDSDNMVAVDGGGILNTGGPNILT